MASSMKSPVLLMLIILSFLFSMCSSSPPLSSMCYPQMNPFLRDLQLQCPTTIASSSAIEMDGESVDNLLSSSKTNAYTAILFYASWCPFSKIVQPKFDVLALMYPQIKHVKVEQSSTLPRIPKRKFPASRWRNKGPVRFHLLRNHTGICLFSRHGVHSVPSILIANKTARVHYHGPKDIHSLSEFYQITTGLKHAMNITEDDNSSQALYSWNQTSLKDEPYLVLSLLFVLLKAFLFLCPDIVTNVIALWVTYVPRLNLAIFGESKQLLTRAFHLFDVKSAFSNLKLSKSRKFHDGARSARVLASSLASVSLGETSSARE